MITYNQTLALSLIELTVTLSIIAILSGISFSTYSKLKIEYRRNEALVKMVQLKTNLQQRAISERTNVIELLRPVIGSKKSIIDEDDYYSYSVAENTGSSISYTITATAIRDKPQSKDRECPTITLTVTEGEEDNKLPVTCWGKN